MSQLTTMDRVEAGAALYTTTNLQRYDFVLHKILNPLVYKCDPKHLHRLHAEHVTNNHLDVGVGTGIFLDKHAFGPGPVRIGLIDLNQDPLNFCAARLARYNPITFRANVLEPVAWRVAPFESLGLTYLFHCVPGDIVQNGVVIDNLRHLLVPSAKVFGATLLGRGVPAGWMARRAMNKWNENGYFTNREDDLDGLEKMLKQRCKNVRIELQGCAALFSGTLA